MHLPHHVIILTGATAGIGHATAHLLAAEGCRLVLVARTPQPLVELSETLNQQSGQTIAIPADMGDTTQAAQIVDKAVAVFGTVHAIINNAAIGVHSTVADLDETQARQVMDVNYFGPTALIQAALPYLKQNETGGLILNISSIIGRRAVPSSAGYCASKAALEHMAESLRLEVAQDNIRVCTIYPGVTRTDFVPRSLGNPPQTQRTQGVSPERVAQTILSALRDEPRDRFVTWFDWLFVHVDEVWPSFMDWLLRLYLNRRKS